MSLVNSNPSFWLTEIYSPYKHSKEASLKSPGMLLSQMENANRCRNIHFRTLTNLNPRKIFLYVHEPIWQKRDVLCNALTDAEDHPLWGQADVGFILCKTKLAPCLQFTVPQLEFCANRNKNHERVCVWRMGINQP